MDTRNTPPSNTTPGGGPRQGWKTLPGAAKAAVILSALGFVVRLTFQTTSTSNGVVTECSYTDIGGIGFGLAAIVAGALTLVAAFGMTRRNLIVAIGVGAVLVGGLNTARGFGVFHDCGPTGSASATASSFGPDDALDRADEQLGNDDTLPPATSSPTPEEGWAAAVEVASVHRNETLRVDLPDDWTVTSDGGGTPTRQQLPEAVSGDGAIELVGYASALTPAEQEEFRQDAAEGDTDPAQVGEFDGWVLVDRSNSFITRYSYFVLEDDFFAKVTFQVDKEADIDPAEEIEPIIATLTLE